MPTTSLPAFPALPGVPAGEITAVTLRRTRAFWPVDLSIDTAHDHVAVVKLNGVTGWFLVTWQPSETLAAGGRWVTFGDGRPYPTITEALADVTTVVAAHFA